MHLIVAGNVGSSSGSVQQAVEDRREGKHGEQGGVQIARVLVALDAFVPASNRDHVLHRGVWRTEARNHWRLHWAKVLTIGGWGKGFFESWIRYDMGVGDKYSFAGCTVK